MPCLLREPRATLREPGLWAAHFYTCKPTIRPATDVCAHPTHLSRSEHPETSSSETAALTPVTWLGPAKHLCQLYAATSDRSYLDGAVAVAQWLQTNTFDTRGSGGYTGGYTARDAKIEWKSTEHNIDLYAFFTMLATESGNGQWSESAAWAKQFVASMWDAREGRFYVGTGNDGVTPNRSFKPEDVNSWSYLAFENPAWAAAPSWDVEHLNVSRGRFAGVSFCSGDRSGVWFEGTAHLAAPWSCGARPATHRGRRPISATSSTRRPMDQTATAAALSRHRKP